MTSLHLSSGALHSERAGWGGADAFDWPAVQGLKRPRVQAQRVLANAYESLIRHHLAGGHRNGSLEHNPGNLHTRQLSGRAPRYQKRTSSEHGGVVSEPRYSRNVRAAGSNAAGFTSTGTSTTSVSLCGP